MGRNNFLSFPSEKLHQLISNVDNYARMSRRNAFINIGGSAPEPHEPSYLSLSLPTHFFNTIAIAIAACPSAALSRDIFLIH